MKIIHLANYANKFFLWGESTTLQYPIDSEREVSQVLRLPHQMKASELQEFIINISSCKLKMHETDSMLWLPTIGLTPAYSSPLIESRHTIEGIKELKPWLVHAIEINPERLIDIMVASLDTNIIQPGLVVGSEMHFLGQVFKVAANLVIRHQFLPMLYDCGNEYQAHWRPIINGQTQEVLKKLAKAWPPLLRLQISENPQPVIENSDIAVSNMLHYMLDAVIRVSNKCPVVYRFLHKNIHNAFIDALYDRDPVVDATVKKIKPFEQELQSWTKPLAMIYDTPFILCFKIEEPSATTTHKTKKKISQEEGAQEWTISYFLKAVHDPSLLIPVDKALNASGQIKKIFQNNNFDPHEYLLYAFGRASRISAQVANSLKGSVPGSCTISPSQVCDFLVHSVPALQDTGFDVIVPAWCVRGQISQSPIKVRASIKNSNVSLGILNMNTVLDFDWQISLGDADITLKELTAIAKLKEPFVNIRGKWVFIEPAMINRAVELLKNTKKASVNDLFRWSLGVQESSFDDLKFEGVVHCPSVDQLLHNLEQKKPNKSLVVPDTFNGTLRDYQFDGYAWLNYLYECRLGACLADDMGLGKTVQMLACLEKVWPSDERRPSLLICPTSVTGNWFKEAARFTPDLPVMVHHGYSRQKNELFKKQACDHALVISSYTLLHRDFELFKDVEWNMLILDEAQNIKNSETKQAKAAKSLKADFRVALTGTPVENSVGDLWSIMDFLNPGFLGNKTNFKKRFLVPIAVNKDQEAVRKLQRITSPFIMRRLKTDKNIIKDLPEKIETNVLCTLTKEQVSLYKAIVDDVSKALNAGSDGIERKGLILATLMKFKQICDHPMLFLKDGDTIVDRSGKLMRITEMLEEILANNEKALIFTQFREMGDILKSSLETTFCKETLFLHGGTSKKDRDAMVEYFQTDQGPSLFVLSLKAGGVGLNLTKAQHVFHFDRWWNPAVENQATDRAFRIGQVNNVQVHKFVTMGTLEERINEMIEQKKELAQSIVTSSEQWITNLNNRELHELFALAKDALGD